MALIFPGCRVQGEHPGLQQPAWGHRYATRLGRIAGDGNHPFI